MFSIAPRDGAPPSGASKARSYGSSPGLPVPLRVCDSRKRRLHATDSEQIELLIQELLDGDLLHRRQSERIQSHQRRLKLRVSAPAWRLYLLLEEAELRRWTYLLDRVAEQALPRRRLR